MEMYKRVFWGVTWRGRGTRVKGQNELDACTAPKGRDELGPLFKNSGLSAHAVGSDSRRGNRRLTTFYDTY
jgi:hypothetical protein